MATPPVFQAEYEAASWTTTTTPKTVTPTTAVGDILAVVGATENATATTLATPTGNGLTYSLQQSIEVGGNSRCAAYGWTAPDNTGGAGWTLSDSSVGSALEWGYTVARFSGSAGVGASAKTDVAGGAPSLNITTQADNSAIVVISADFAAVDGATRTWRTVNGTTPTAANGFELVYARDAAAYTVYVAYYPDAGAAGVKTVGLSAPGAQTYSIIAVEIKGTAAAAGGAGTLARHGPGHRRGPLGRMDLLRAYHHRRYSTEVGGVATFPVDVTDSAGLTDSVEFVQQLERTDSAGLTDTTASTQALVRTDDAGLTDAATQALIKTVDATDSVGLTDTVAFTEALERTDSAGLTDAALIQQQLVRTDSVGLTDSSTIQVVKAVTADDPIGLTDTTAFTEQLVRTDSAGLTDTVGLIEQLVRTDSVGLTDSATAVKLTAIESADSAGLTDTALITASYLRAFIDNVGLSDAVDIGGIIIPKAGWIEPGTRAYVGIASGPRVGVGAEPGTRGAAAVVTGVRAGAQAEPGTRTGPSVEGGG